MIVFSLTGCIGEHFVMALIKRWGALIAVVVTSLRKLLTVVLSFVIFPKPLSFIFFCGMVRRARMLRAARCCHDAND